MARKKKSPDSVCFSQDPYQLSQEIHRTKQAKAHEHSESRTLLQLYHQRPEYSPETLVGSIISFTGLKKLGFSVVGEAVDQAVNRVAKPLRARLVTDGGTSSQRQAVKAKNRIIEGLQREQILKVGKPLLYDAAFNADGFGYALRMADANGNLKLYRLDPFETHITRDGLKATTTRYLSKREAKALYGGEEEIDEAIDNAEIERPEYIAGVDSSSSHELHETIAIRYGWVLPAGKQKGREVVQLDANTVLVDREWKHPVLPVIPLKVQDGFRDGEAKPVGRALAPYQYWLNSLLQKLWVQIQAQVPHLVEEEGAETKAPSDLPFQRWTYKKGKKPADIVLPKTVSGDIIAHLDRLHQGALREIGASDGSTEVIPPGIKSGLAIQEYRQEVQIRLSGWSYGWQEFVEQDARVIAHLAPELYAKKAVRIRAENTDLLESVKWPQAAKDAKEETWTIVIQSSGALPTTISGRLETASQFKEAGVDIDPLDIMAMFENPDLRALFAPKLAPRERVQAMIDRALEKGEAITPDETLDPVYGAKLAADHYNLAMLKGTYERKETDALFRVYLMFAARAEQAQAQAAPAPGATNPAPTGAVPLTQ